MNILGQPFEEWVTKQINYRQQILGQSINRDPQTYQAYTTKSPWVRLASAVDFKKDSKNYNKLKELGIPENDLVGSNLAKKCILQGGVVSQITNLTEEQKLLLTNALGKDLSVSVGLTKENNPLSGAYGWGGITGQFNRGYVPMPGITGISVEYQNNGALTKTSVDLICHSKTQLSIIDALYLRPGYNLLLEFGWSQYLDENGKLQSFNDFWTEPLTNLFKDKPTQFDVFSSIKKTKFKYSGNYEAVFGKIVNFNWSLEKDGSYKCSIKLTGMGDVIEGLKVNIPSSKPQIQTTQASPSKPVKQSETKPEENPPLIANATKTQLNTVLYNIYQKAVSGKASTFKVSDHIIDGFSDLEPLDPKQGINSPSFIKLSNFTIPKAILTVPGTKLGEKEKNQSPQVYITFGALIAEIQDKLLLYDLTEENRKIPQFIFDMKFWDLEQDENYILKVPGQFSSNPRVCLIPYTGINIVEGNNPLKLDIPSTPLNDAITKNGAKWEKSTFLGRLANIYVNISHIAKVLDTSTRSDDGSISLLTLLNTLIGDINKSLGNINSISIQSTQDGKIKFIENAPQKFDESQQQDDTKYAKFNVFGVKINDKNPFDNLGIGSIAKNLTISAQISNQFAAMISIGAQANGNKAQGNATAFSSYNEGLIDRTMPEKTDYVPPSQKTEDQKKSELTLVSNWNTNIYNPKAENGNIFTNIYKNLSWINDNIEGLVESNTLHTGLIVGELCKLGINRQLQSPFFLPFELSLEIEGLSGMVLYQRFTINTDMLPTAYEPDSVDLILSGINHKVDKNGWSTSLKTKSVPKSKLRSPRTPSPTITESV